MKQRSVKAMLAEAESIKAGLEAGKFKGRAIQKAKYRMGNLRYRAKQKEKKAIASANELLKQGQGILPGLLKQLDVVRIEELVAEKLFQTIQSGEGKVSRPVAHKVANKLVKSMGRKAS